MWQVECQRRHGIIVMVEITSEQGMRWSVIIVCVLKQHPQQQQPRLWRTTTTTTPSRTSSSPTTNSSSRSSVFLSKDCSLLLFNKSCWSNSIAPHSSTKNKEERIAAQLLLSCCRLGTNERRPTALSLQPNDDEHSPTGTRTFLLASLPQNSQTPQRPNKN